MSLIINHRLRSTLTVMRSCHKLLTVYNIQCDYDGTALKTPGMVRSILTIIAVTFNRVYCELTTPSCNHRLFTYVYSRRCMVGIHYRATRKITKINVRSRNNAPTLYKIWDFKMEIFLKVRIVWQIPLRLQSRIITTSVTDYEAQMHKFKWEGVNKMRALT